MNVIEHVLDAHDTFLLLPRSSSACALSDLQKGLLLLHILVGLVHVDSSKGSAVGVLPAAYTL